MPVSSVHCMAGKCRSLGPEARIRTWAWCPQPGCHKGIWIQIVRVFSTVRWHCHSSWEGRPVASLNEGQSASARMSSTGPMGKSREAAALQGLPAIPCLPLHNAASYHRLGSANRDPALFPLQPAIRRDALGKPADMTAQASDPQSAGPCVGESNGTHIPRYTRHVRYTFAVPECNMALHGPWDGGRCRALPLGTLMTRAQDISESVYLGR